MPRTSPYARYDDHKLTLADVLAVDRTVVANERTLLGYARTTLALLAAGGSLLHFFEGPLTTISGWVFVAGAVPMWAIGLRHYLRRRAALVPLMHKGHLD